MLRRGPRRRAEMGACGPLLDSFRQPAEVVELVDTQDLGSCAFGREGSSPFFGTQEYPFD